MNRHQPTQRRRSCIGPLAVVVGLTAVLTVQAQPPDVELKAVQGVIDEVVVEQLNAEPADMVALMADQLFNQHNSLLDAELAFIKRVAQATDEQMEQMRAEATNLLRDATRKNAEWNNRMQRQRARIVWNNQGFVQHQDPVRMFHEGLGAIVKAKLTPEQFARYEQENQKRSEFRKQATISSIIAEFDSVVLLTDEQRRQIREALNNNWNDDWYQRGNALLYHRHRSFGPLDLTLVMNALTPSQIESWQALAGNAVQVWGQIDGGQFIHGGGGMIFIDQAEQVLELDIRSIEEPPVLDAAPLEVAPAEGPPPLLPGPALPPSVLPEPPAADEPVPQPE